MASYEIVIRDGFKHAKDCDSTCVQELDGWIGGSFKKFGIKGYECQKCHELTKIPLSI
jgi:hypothetical protein